MPKVTLVNTPHPWLSQPKQQFPLGLLYVASILEEKGYEVSILDCSDLTILQFIMEGMFSKCLDTDYVGFSATYPDSFYVEQIASYIKSTNPNIKTVLGGIHPTVAIELVNTELFDIIIQGEAEEILYSIPLEKLSGIIKTGIIHQLDKYPLPVWHLLEEDSYRKSPVFHHGINLREGGSMPIMLSRGCPRKCSFCSSFLNLGIQVRYYGKERIEKEIKEIVEKYKVYQLRFQDDNFTVNKGKTREILRILRKYDVVWRCSTSVSMLDQELLFEMYQSGCREIGIGIESADKSVQNCLNKYVNLDLAWWVINWIKNANIWVRLFFMIGTPGETEKTVDLNIEFIERTNPDLVTFSIFGAYPGSAIWNEPEKFGIKILTRNPLDYIMNPSPDLSIIQKSSIKTIGLTNEQMIDNITRMRQYIYHERKVGNIGV